MAKRLDKITSFLEEKQIDAILLTSKNMKKWMDTMLGSGCRVLITRKKGYLILDGRYITEAKEKEHDLEIILHNPHTTGKNYLGSVKAILEKDRCSSLGIEASEILVKEYEQMKELDVDLYLLDDEIMNLRIVKDEEEIKRMKETIRKTDEIYENVIKNIRVGMSEYEICALVQYYSFACGAQQMSFDTIVSSGERTALPHGRPSARKVKAHEPIMIDFGIQYNNYQSDMTRVCFIGEPEEKYKKIYDVVLKAQLTGLAAIKAGARACDVDKAARQVIIDAGYGDYFDHGLGHGIGVTDSGEGPILNSKSTVILKEHMMMSCEPGVYLPGVGGIRIEDDVIIENGLGVPMNKSPKTIRILEEK